MNIAFSFRYFISVDQSHNQSIKVNCLLRSTEQFGLLPHTLIRQFLKHYTQLHSTLESYFGMIKMFSVFILQQDITQISQFCWYAMKKIRYLWFLLGSQSSVSICVVRDCFFFTKASEYNVVNNVLCRTNATVGTLTIDLSLVACTSQIPQENSGVQVE